MNILVCDPITPEAITNLKENGLTVNYKPAISHKELEKIIPEYEFLVVKSRTKVTSYIIEKGKRLKAIGRVGTGLDNIDIESCKTNKITLVNAPSANSESVAELTVALMLSLVRNLDKAFSSMENGEWIKGMLSGEELSGKTIGIVGYGFIGKRIEELLKPFGCKFLIFSLNYSNCTLQDLFANSDVITLHLNLNESTKNIVNEKLIGNMKKSSYLINTSRGGIVNEEALYMALYKNKIKGAALDVYWEEPLPEDSRWRKLSNCILTPHLGAATEEAQTRAGMLVAESLIKVSKGEEPKYKVI